MSNWFQRNRHLYPENWPEISYEIKVRDGFKCKWCGAPNEKYIARYDDGFLEFPNEEAAMFHNAVNKVDKAVKIILTVAHLGTEKRDGSPCDKKDKSDCRPENLAALCQRCHLRFDVDEHVYNSAITRRRKRIEAGQLEFAL